ncbi:hypothetical protein ACN28S_27655 [Cystobacter fuscus]
MLRAGAAVRQRCVLYDIATKTLTHITEVVLAPSEKRMASRLTDTLNPEIDAKDLVMSEVVRFKSFDGLERCQTIRVRQEKPG